MYNWDLQLNAETTEIANKMEAHTNIVSKKTSPFTNNCFISLMFDEKRKLPECVDVNVMLD